MKKQIFFVSTLILSIIFFSGTLLSGQITITSPANGQIIKAPAGSSCVSFTLYWNKVDNPYPYYPCDPQWDIVVRVDGVVYPAWENWWGIDVCGFGSHSIKIEMYQVYIMGGRQLIDEDVKYFTIASQGNLTSFVSLMTRGSISDSKTSSYISPGSTVSWSLSVSTFNVSPAITTASAQISSPISQSVSRYNTGYYAQLDGNNNGSYNYANGGTLTLTTNVSISSNNGCGGTAFAYISW